LLRFNDRMASVGTLAAGIAHEINNPLTYVITNLSVALNRVRQSEVEDALSEALEGACRVRSIVRELRTFSKPDDTPLGPVDVVNVFESALWIVGNEVRHRATLERELDEMPPVYGNAAKLGQVFVNGLVNAIQALDEGEAADHIVRVSTTEIGGKVVAEISDTGRGMPPEVLAQAFDPFFTTKAVGHGMGLGLTICHNII